MAALEQRSAESEGEVRLFTGTQNFFFVPRSWQDEKTSLSMSVSLNQLPVILATLATEIRNLPSICFLRCEGFDLNEDKLEQEYHN